MALLDIKDVRGGYGDADILHGVSMTVGEREIVVIVGPNGAGKSTAMKSVFGLLAIRGGSIVFDGEDITGWAPDRIVQRGICYVPQVDNVFREMTVHENFEMGAFLRRGDLSAAYDAAWRTRLATAAASAGMPLHQGVYAGLRGPQYETPAEVRMLRTLGADAVGMSTVLETIQARALGLTVTGLSCLTNWAAGISPTPLDHHEVLATGKAAADAMITLLTHTLGQEPAV